VAEDNICVCTYKCIYTRKDLTTRPKTTCFPSSHDVIAVVRKNCQVRVGKIVGVRGGGGRGIKSV
jgi:hypothetical protein